jgi:hypothetical protein
VERGYATVAAEQGDASRLRSLAEDAVRAMRALIDELEANPAANRMREEIHTRLREAVLRPRTPW